MSGAGPEGFTVRILGADGNAVGIGALVGERHVVTCAHVVNVALGLGKQEQAKPAGLVTIDFPLLDGEPRVQASVDVWLPPPREGAAGDSLSALRVEEGFSGSPVFDDDIGQVVGLIALAPYRVSERDSRAIGPDGSRLAAASGDETVAIYDLETVMAFEKQSAMRPIARTVMKLGHLPDGGYATLLPDGKYKLEGDPGDRLWWAMKLCRFHAGELDPYVLEIEQLGTDASLPLKTARQRGTNAVMIKGF